MAAGMALQRIPQLQRMGQAAREAEPSVTIFRLNSGAARPARETTAVAGPTVRATEVVVEAAVQERRG